MLFLRVLDDGKSLRALHDALEEMVPVRLTRKFHPHVTWTRNPKRILLKEIVEKNTFNMEKEYIPGQLILYESLSTRGKTIYLPHAQQMLFQR